MGGGASYDPQQLPAIKGRVAQYSLTPRGDVDGVILDDGTEVQGQVQRVLPGPAGDVNGALLADGTQLRVPPPAAYQAASVLQPGQAVAAQGFALGTPYGRVVDVQAIGPSPDRLAQLAPPPPPGGPGAPPPPAAGGPGTAPFSAAAPLPPGAATPPVAPPPPPAAPQQ